MEIRPNGQAERAHYFWDKIPATWETTFLMDRLLYWLNSGCSWAAAGFTGAGGEPRQGQGGGEEPGAAQEGLGGAGTWWDLPDFLL